MTKIKKKKHRNRKPFIIAFIAMVGLFAAIRHIFALNIPQLDKSKVKQPHLVEVFVGDSIQYNDTIGQNFISHMDETGLEPTMEEAPETTEARDSISMDNDSTATDSMRYNPSIHGVWSYSECFPDSQDVQIVAAEKNGVPPLDNRNKINELIRKHKLVNISHSPYFALDDLTHSIPYLVPKAYKLVNTIGINFMDSLRSKGMPLHLPLVTSVLRTTEDVSKLQNGNKNATTNSCHCYGTTVDIAYHRYVPITGTYNNSAQVSRWDDDMKRVLSEVLYDLRKQGKCYVKYEKKQGCFHLTVR